MIDAKDLTQEPPRSPRVRVGGYPLLARMADKDRAAIAGTAGEYHFDCPLDRMLFGFKGVEGDEVRKLLEGGVSDEEVATWLDGHGEEKTPQQVSEWAGQVEGYRPYDDPEKRDWFVGECEPLGLDPKSTTLFDYLEADDRASFGK